MLGTPKKPRTPPLDSSRSALEFLHRLLVLPAEEQTNLEGVLKGLSAAFAATAAGLATFPEGVPLCAHPARMDDCGLPMEDLLSLLNHQSAIDNPQSKSGALTVSRRSGGSCLFTLMGTPERGGWLLWLEDDNRTHWNESEAALLVLAGQILAHRLMREESPAPWVVQLERGSRRQRMEAAAHIVRRLAHDFGNFLTGILGFSQLSLAHQAASSAPLRDYLTEIHRSAQTGAHYIDQLRLFARRQARRSHAEQGNEERGNLAHVLAEVRSEWRDDVQLTLHLPVDLPAVAVDSEALRQVLAVILDNAREAIAGAGVIDISARMVQVNAWQACKLFGYVRPGPHLEIRIADNGSGLTPEAQRQLFAEPFFSTKPRKRGFGLAMAYGILSAYRGGLELLSRPEGGTIARLIVPVAPRANVVG
jgi:signal transduction histidine kinase